MVVRRTRVAWMDVEQARMDARIDEELSDERAMGILREELFVRAIDAATASAEQAAGEQEERSGADDDPGDAADVMRAAGDFAERTAQKTFASGLGEARADEDSGGMQAAACPRGAVLHSESGDEAARGALPYEQEVGQSD